MFILSCSQIVKFTAYLTEYEAVYIGWGGGGGQYSNTVNMYFFIGAIVVSVCSILTIYFNFLCMVLLLM